MCKYFTYYALLMVICVFGCSPPEMNNKQILKENLENSVMVDSIEQQVKKADAELKSFLKNE